MRTLLCTFSIVLLAGCLPTEGQDGGVDSGTGNDVVVDSSTQDARNDVVVDTGSDAIDDAGAGNCSLVGAWRGTIPGGPFAGQQLTWTFAAGGVSNGVFGTATVDGTWAVSGSVATLTDTVSVPVYVACAAGQQGSYTISYSAACTMLAWHATSDPCDGRRLAVDTLSVTRQ
ncbi:MAG: hypothetical protein WCJ30_27060 [Deltaproteobacteria bacterium]